MDNLENELEVLTLQLRDEQDNVATLNEAIKEHDEREAAAKELLTEAEAVLAQPPQAGVTAEARYDKQQAEKVLERVGQERPVLQARLQACKARLERLQERKRQFPMAELERQRRVERLRRQMR